MRQIYYGKLRLGVAPRLAAPIRAEQRHAARLTGVRRGVASSGRYFFQPLQVNRAGSAGNAPLCHFPSGIFWLPAAPSTCRATFSVIPRGRRNIRGACRFQRPLRGLQSDKPVLPRRHRDGTLPLPFRDMHQHLQHTNTRTGIGKPSSSWPPGGGATGARHGLPPGGWKVPARRVWLRPSPRPTIPAHSANALPPPCGNLCCRLFPSSFLWAGCPCFRMAHEEIASGVPQSVEIGVFIATAHHSSQEILWIVIAVGELLD